MKPSFIVAGEAKCGTTSLYRYLTRHPGILPADRKEPNNFIDHPGSLVQCRSHYPLSMSCWRRQLAGQGCLTGEASAEYFSRRDVAGDIAGSLPGVRIIVLVRNPSIRALSDWAMLHEAGVLDESFTRIVDKGIRWLSDPDLRPIVEDAGQIEHSPVRIVLRGIYVNNMRRWQRYFDKDHLRVYASEDLFENPLGVVNDAFHYLGLSGHHIGKIRKFREGGYDRGQYQADLDRLADFYRPYNLELGELLGRNLPWD